jgi:cation transport protein ChaC
MWRPGFDHREAVPARLSGAHRSLCLLSWVHRGTRAQPGLVLGLDRGGSCRGVAFRVAARNRDAVMAYLRERELITGVYKEVTRPVMLLDGKGESVAAITYVIDRSHEQYAGHLPPTQILAMVKAGTGKSGTNAEYIIATVRHLRAAGIRDATLEWLAQSLGGEREGRR